MSIKEKMKNLRSVHTLYHMGEGIISISRTQLKDRFQTLSEEDFTSQLGFLVVQKGE